MGQQAECAARFGRRTSQGTAHLETAELTFRGDFRLNIPFKDVASVTARKGKLTVKFSEGVATFELGSAAEKWALKILYPRSLLDKLGVKPESRVAVLGVEDGSFSRDLKERSRDVSHGKPRKESDLIFFAAGSKGDLKRLKALRELIKSNGAIWVVWPKGQKALTEDHVRAHGPEVGLVDVKVVSFSDTLSALKMVIPVSLRRS